MPSLTVNTSVSGDGVALGRAKTRTGDAVHRWSIALPAAKAGSLTTRTDASTGTVTMSSASHGITTAAVVDLYWDGGRRYGVTVGTVAGTAVPFSGGAGDDLPSASTSLTVSEQVVATCNIDGDNVQVLGLFHELPDSDSGKASAQFVDSGAATIAQVDLDATKAVAYDVAGGETNPFTGNPIVSVRASNGSSDNAGTLSIVSLEDSTP